MKIEFNPSIKPTLVWVASIVVTVVLIEGVLLANREQLGAAVNIIGAAIALIAIIITMRLLIKLIVLKRTRYVLTENELRREFEFLYNTREREIPINQLRGIQLTRNRIQTILGYGDLTFLTAGTNQSLGFLTFDDIPEPSERREQIRAELTEQ